MIKKWLLITENGEILDSFKYKLTAIQIKPKYKICNRTKLRVVTRKEYEELWKKKDEDRIEEEDWYKDQFNY